MAVTEVEITIGRDESLATGSPRGGGRVLSVAILGKPTETNCALAAAFAGLGHRAWLVRPTGRDLRVVVAAGKVVGAIERVALPGEWRTNVALGAVRRRVSAPPAVGALALRAVAALGIDLAGVDIATDTECRSYVLEINGAVDFNRTYGGNVFAAAAAALFERAATRSPAQPGSRFGAE